jgi:protein-L-isoaspartate(D-aspartate) O-methyltransferase
MRLGIVVLVAVTGAACSNGRESQAKKKAEAVAEVRRDAAERIQPDERAIARFEMVDRTIVARGITDERVIAALRITPRHEFVPPAIRHQAYDDRALPIGFDLTISQPYIIAAMTEAVKVKAGDKVLEIGTGSGYQAAVLAMMGAKVYTMEIHPELGARTKKVLEQLGFKEVAMRIADGYFGWEEAAPFDAIMITCATPEIPAPLLAQLRPGGRLIAPIGDEFAQQLTIITKTPDGQQRDAFMDVRFGPMKGEIDKPR